MDLFVLIFFMDTWLEVWNISVCVESLLVWLWSSIEERFV